MSIYSSLLEQANDARTRIREVSAEEAGQPGDNGTVFLDVREVAEFRAGHIPGAILLSRGGTRRPDRRNRTRQKTRP